MQKLLQKNKIIKYVCFAVSGVVTCLTLIFPAIGFLEWISMIPAAAAFIWLAENENVGYGRMYKYGFVYFMSFYLTAFHWFLALYPLSFVEGFTNGTAALVVFLGWVGLSLLQGSVSALVPVLIALVARRGICKRMRILVPVGAAAIYTVFEWMQTLTWAGVPFTRLAIGQTESAAMLKTASLLGSYLITFLIVGVNFCFALGLLTDAKQKRKICVAAATLTVALNGVVGGLLILADNGITEEKFVAAAIQPNIGMDEKWSTGLALTNERLEKYCAEAKERGAKLIVMPESTYPTEILGSGYNIKFLKELAVKCDATLVVGCFTDDGENDYNSLIFIDPEGNVSDTVYSKRRLVPFGEFVPMRDFFTAIIPALTEISMLEEDLTPGDGSAIYDSKVGRLGSLICFDSIYESLTLESVRDGAEIMMISSNDAWFLDSAGVELHNSQARIRAVEVGRYFVRSANTGISTMIDPCGRVLDREEALVDGYVVAEIAARSNRTLYSYVGNLLVWLSMVFIAVALFDIKKNKL